MWIPDASSFRCLEAFSFKHIEKNNFMSFQCWTILIHWQRYWTLKQFGLWLTLLPWSTWAWSSTLLNSSIYLERQSGREREKERENLFQELNFIPKEDQRRNQDGNKDPPLFWRSERFSGHLWDHCGPWWGQSRAGVGHTHQAGPVHTAARMESPSAAGSWRTSLLRTTKICHSTWSIKLYITCEKNLLMYELWPEQNWMSFLLAL